MPPRASTPPAAGTATIPQSFYLQSTPYSRGSGSHYSYQSQHCQDDYKPYLREDLARQYKISFNKFLNDILCHGLSLASANASQNHDIVSDRRFQTLLSKYRKPVDQETGRYTPFIELANHVIDQLNTNPNSKILFCRNDPVTIEGSHAHRKPDVVVVLNKSLEVPERGGVDNLMEHGPKQASFWWTELLSFFEFKLAQKCLEPQDAATGDHGSTVVPLALNSPVGASPSPSTSRTPCEELAIPPISPHFASPSLISSTSESKRSPNTLSPNPSSRAKRRKLDGTTIDQSMLQCASYALEMMSHGGLRSHVIGALVIDDTIQLLYYDRSIFLKSEPLKFLEDPLSFVAMLRAMGNLPLSQLGHANLITPPPFSGGPRRSKDIFDGLTLTLTDGTDLRLGSTIYQQHGIIGRGTCVVRATYITGSKAWVGPLVVKLSWPAKSRVSENDLIAKARNAADHDEHRWVLKHLPKVLHAEDRQIESLSPALIAGMGQAYEERVLRIIVQEELYPITERTNAVDLAQSFREIFKCYRWLYEVPKILHRDISLNNLMLRKEDGNVYAVLNDLDLAVEADVQGQSSKQRTGTKPFMAIDLLTPSPPVHMYRHDLESLFYVLVWITSRFHDGVEIKKPPLALWEGRDMDVRSFKFSFLMQEELFEYEPTDQFESFKGLIERMCGMFEEGHRAKRRAGRDPYFARNFTIDTLGGHVTFDTFQSILDADLP